MTVTMRWCVLACAMSVLGAAVCLPLRAAGGDVGAKVNAKASAKVASVENLAKAYANGALAMAQSKAFAAKADEEGYKSVAALFRAAEYAEGIHMKKYEMALKDLGSAVSETKLPEVTAKTTKENLETLIKAVEANAVAYGDYIKQAQKDGATKAGMFLGGAVADEASRGKLYKQAAADLDGWKAAGKEIIVCEVCGFTTIDGKLKTCPVCSAPREKFKLFK